MKLIDNEATIKIVQATKYRWEIQSSQGFVLQNNIFLNSEKEAEDYVKNYLSSYQCWSYEVVPLKESKK